jgi:hypothetical protein
LGAVAFAACKWVKLACERYERDAKAGALDDTKGGRICFITELLPHIKGKWARQREFIKLEPWQVFTLFSLFGTVNEQGLRRYREAYISMLVAICISYPSLASAIQEQNDMSSWFQREGSGRGRDTGRPVPPGTDPYVRSLAHTALISDV